MPSTAFLGPDDYRDGADADPVPLHGAVPRSPEALPSVPSYLVGAPATLARLALSARRAAGRRT